MSDFFDTSALIKKYISERGSDIVRLRLNQSSSIIVSSTAKIECFSVLSRMLAANEISLEQVKYLHSQIAIDFSAFKIVPFNNKLIEHALKMVQKHNLRTLDAIQLSSALQISRLKYFVVTDIKLKASAEAEGFHVIDPNE